MAREQAQEILQLAADLLRFHQQNTNNVDLPRGNIDCRLVRNEKRGVEFPIIKSAGCSRRPCSTNMPRLSKRILSNLFLLSEILKAQLRPLLCESTRSHHARHAQKEGGTRQTTCEGRYGSSDKRPRRDTHWECLACIKALQHGLTQG